MGFFSNDLIFLVNSVYQSDQHKIDQCQQQQKLKLDKITLYYVTYEWLMITRNRLNLTCILTSQNVY